MRVITTLDSETYDQVEKIAREEGYSDVDQFIRVAIQNQISLEKDQETQTGEAANNVVSGNAEEEEVWGQKVPASPPVDEPYEMNREKLLLFQQYYRFFPLVAVMRELARATDDIGGPIALDEFSEQMQQAVLPIRDSIYDWEQNKGVKKQNRKSTGLPKSDVKNPEYSMRRFLNHYVGKVRRRDNHPKAFGNSLALISYKIVDEGKCLLQLTPAGRSFVQLGNPLLESGPEEPVLSTDEQEFLIEHIAQTLPEEHRFMKFVQETLDKNGNQSYTNRIDDFREFLADSDSFSDDDPSEERARSHTAGVLSRMVELGVLSRSSRRGVYITETPV